MKNKSFLATLLVGAIFGAAVLLSVIGHDLDLLYLQIAKYKTELQQVQEEKSKVELDLKQSQKLRIRRLKKWNLVILDAPDEFSKIAIQNQVKLQLQPLLNKDLSLLEQQPDLFLSLLENRTLDLPNHTITLHVKYIFIGETTSLYIQIQAEEKTIKPTKGT